MLRDHMPYQELGSESYEQRYREQEVRYLQRKAAKLGFELTPREA